MKLLIAFSFLFSTMLMAQEHNHQHQNHDHQHHANLDNYLFLFEGVDASYGSDCDLFVISKSEGQYTVVSSYSHGDASAPEFTVTYYEKDPSWLFGQTETDMIAIALPYEYAPIEEAELYNIQWLHGSHYHYNSCESLQIVE